MTAVDPMRREMVAAGLAMLALAACTRRPMLVNIPVAAVRTGRDLVTDADVRGAIDRAGRGLGWAIREDAPGRLVATRTESSRMASVDIRYQMSFYGIRYRDSRNLHYWRRVRADAAGAIHDPDAATIDAIYNEWVSALDQAIQRELAYLN